jgi:hypothetical protein
MSRLRTFLRNNYKAGDPVRVVANHTQANRIANILQDIEGYGCQIQKPTAHEGRGWKIVVSSAVLGASEAVEFRIVTDGSTYYVRGGCWEWYEESTYRVAEAAWGATADDLYDLTGNVAGDAVTYIYAILDMPGNAVSIYANTTAWADSTDTTSYRYHSLGQVNADGTITQYWYGGRLHNWYETETTTTTTTAA